MGNSNFIKDIIDSLLGGNDPEVAKKRALKNIAKNLSKTKYKFYKMGANEVEPGLAKFFYDIYKVVSPAQVMFQSVSPSAYKKMVLDHSLSQKQQQILEQISEEAITEASRKIPLKELSEKTMAAYNEFAGEFDSARIVRLDSLYTKLVLFAAFCQIDYYFTLKKFDSSLKEKNFSQEPRFQTINGSYVLEDLKNFADAAWVLPLDDDWEDLFKLLRLMKGVEPVTHGAWKKILSRLRNMKEKHIFEMLVQLISDNPSYHEEYRKKELNAVDDYLADIKKSIEKTLEDLKAKQTAGKVDNLLGQVFGTTEVDRLKYYNESGSAPFERKQVGAYEYHEPLAFLRQFLLDYVKKDVRELSDILLVRGEWVNQQMATPMSDAFHKLTENVDKIAKLDNSVNETLDLGLKMKTLLPRVDRDKESRNIIESTLKYVNNTAGTIILESIKLFVVYDRNLKMILEDCVKAHPELIRNWKDIDHFAEGQLKQMCIDVYKKIYLLVSLLQQYPITIKEE